MKVGIVRATDEPEKLVCEAARNDYRSEGVLDHAFEDMMSEASIDAWAIDEVVNERDLDLYPEEDQDWEEVVADLPEDVELEARRRTLLTHLMDSGHWGPFEHPQATISLEGVTRVLMAQITRHRHFTFDIMSLRYVGLDDGFELVAEAGVEAADGDLESELSLRFQIPKGVEEGGFKDRHGWHELDDAEKVKQEYVQAYKRSVESYLTLLEEGVPQEEARKVLPMGTKVNITMSSNARAWMHILHVRTKANVQGETRRAAEAILEELKNWMPYTFEKFDEMQDKKLKHLNP